MGLILRFLGQLMLETRDGGFVIIKHGEMYTVVVVVPIQI